MKKILMITLAFSLLFTGCGNASNGKSKGGSHSTAQTEKNNDKYGLTITAEDITPTGLKLIYTQKDVDYEGELKVFNLYYIETKNKQGDWEDVKQIGSWGLWGETNHTIKKNGITEFNPNWKDIYGELPKGEYRIHLFMQHHITSDEINKAEYFVYFEIE